MQRSEDQGDQTSLKMTIFIPINESKKMNYIMNNDRVYSAKESENKEKKQSVKHQIESNFLKKRQIFLWGPVDDESAEDIVSKLLYLESVDAGKPITFFINSPGGMVTSGFSIMDTINLISSPVSTVCMGLAASMGSILLSAGEKGKRFIYPYGEVMIHQPSIGALRGQASDLEIHAKQIIKTKNLSAEILAKNTGRSFDHVLADFDRDYWMNAEESIKYGIVDEVYSID